MAAQMRGELAGLMEQGKTREQVYEYFMAKWGSQEPLASPIDEGFNRLAWAVPYALGLLGLGIAGVVAVRWARSSQLDGAGAPVATAGPPIDPALEQRLADELRDLD
jgi:cytochrome c-type biogenesis protein CcmH/NrfF